MRCRLYSPCAHLSEKKTRVSVEKESKPLSTQTSSKKGGVRATTPWPNGKQKHHLYMRVCHNARHGIFVTIEMRFAGEQNNGFSYTMGDFCWGFSRGMHFFVCRRIECMRACAIACISGRTADIKLIDFHTLTLDYFVDVANRLSPIERISVEKGTKKLKRNDIKLLITQRND